MRLISNHDLFKLWSEGATVGITTNGNIKHNGKAVMGAGVAKIANEKVPGLDARLGQLLHKNGLRVEYLEDIRMIMIPTKNDYWRPSKMSLVETSCRELAQLGITTAVYIPALGCGCGGLDVNKVIHTISSILPDNFVMINNEDPAFDET